MKQFLFLTLILVVTFQVSIASLDRHMYRGVDVKGQDQEVLLVSLDNRLKLGTDFMCLEASRVLQQVALESGRRVQVVSEDGEWVPFNGQPKSYSELTNIIESGHPY